MAKEIERKFLVLDSSYRDLAVRKIDMMQGYLSVDPDATVRVRIAGEQAFLTVKSRNCGASRNEWEYQVPVSEAREMLHNCCKSRLIEKTRYVIPAENNLFWEIDEFHDALEGLVVAEIEIPAEDYAITLPDFIGEEVTDNPKYYNSSLAAI